MLEERITKLEGQMSAGPNLRPYIQPYIDPTNLYVPHYPPPAPLPTNWMPYGGGSPIIITNGGLTNFWGTNISLIAGMTNATITIDQNWLTNVIKELIEKQRAIDYVER